MTTPNEAIALLREALIKAEYAIKGREHTGFITKALAATAAIADPVMQESPQQSDFIAQIIEKFRAVPDEMWQAIEVANVIESLCEGVSQQPAESQGNAELSVIEDADLIEAVEQRVGMSSRGWDCIDPIQLAQAFRQLLASPGRDALKDAEYLFEGDMKALKRFCECCEDSDADGHDVPKDAMRRLTEIGVVRSVGFGRHETTAFGDFITDRWEGLPLRTYVDRTADSFIAAIATQAAQKEAE